MEQRRSDDRDQLQQPPRAHNQNQNHQPPPPQKCPRCDSPNTKFCYYNNYSLSQPRYFCKACRRYWTQGGTLRNVPVGGGCRKSKRPKPSNPSPSSGQIGSSQPLRPALPTHSLTAALNSGQVLRPLPPIMSSSMSNTFYSGGSFLSSLEAMKSLSNQGGAVNLGGGGGQYEANMTLLQSLKPQAQPQQFQLQNDQYFPLQQNLRPSLTSWTQSFINKGSATTSAGSSSFWNGATSGDGNNQAGSSLNPNQWQDSNPGFDPFSQ